MKLEQFIGLAKIAEAQEVDRACLLAYFFLRKEGVAEFAAAEYAKWIDGHAFSVPNKTRLNEKLRLSANTIKGSSLGRFRLRHEYLRELDLRFPQLNEKSQDVEEAGTILPPLAYEKTRTYIESLAKQINASYENNIFDGCAVLMRRLEEVLLIMSYENKQIGSEIKNADGTYFMLEGIVRNAAGNQKLNLSRTSRKSIDTFREFGNYSAHRLEYTCRREYIREKIDEFRVLIDELLHKAGLRI